MRSRAFISGIVFAATALATPASVGAQDDEGPIVVRHPVLQASLNRLYAESPSWRAALEAVADSGRRAIVVTPEKVRVTDSKGGFKPFDPDVLAEVHPLADDAGRVDAVIVIMNIDLLQTLSRLPVDALEFEEDLDRILAHEIYGHAIPYLLAGSVTGKCADPAAGQRAWSSCAVRRENVIRREMGLGLRLEYGSGSLALARRHWHH
jgi:hypothetical protein